VSKAKAAGALVLGSAALIAFLGDWEGGRDVRGDSVAYADRLAGGLPTVCAGLTRHVTKTPIVVGQKWSAAKCDAEEARAIAVMQSRLVSCFIGPPPQSVFDAASSHAWNNGLSATCGSLAMQAWQRGDWALGCRRLYRSDSGRPVWSYVKTGRLQPNGRPEMKFVQGLANRRVAEYRMCLEGIR
jgi:GH24 family phage-related lysozyme (muramidase)